MNTKTFLFKNYSSLKLLFIAKGISITLLALRIKLTQDFYMLFMGWNLILALIPFVVSMGLLRHVQAMTRPKSSLATTGSIAVLWLLFLPNAPYMLTDLIHTANHSGVLFYIDTVTISSFAITGLITALYSIEHMIIVVSITWKPLSRLQQNSLRHACWWLSALGIYLGRVLRWNSWDAIREPAHIAADVLDLFLNPLTHAKAWLLIIGLGLFLSTVHHIFLKYNRYETRQ